MKYTVTLLALFSFNFLFGQACDGLTSITHNGYTYDLVEIGGQCWFKENLRTTTYNDSSPIYYPGADSTGWYDTYMDSTGAYAWYSNDSTTYAQNYGALYNWYAVDNSAGLCPTGWVVPSDSAWAVLDSFLAQNSYNYDGSTMGRKYGKAMADTILWTASTTAGSIGNTDYPSYRNKSGFSALPGGVRDDDGSYVNVGNLGYWWTSTDIELFLGYFPGFYRNMAFFSFWVGGGHPSGAFDKRLGMSVRCLRDTGSITTSLNEHEIRDLTIYPNPFSNSTIIEFDNPDQKNYQLNVYDVLGNRVRIINNIASNRVELKREILISGIYFIELHFGNERIRGNVMIK